MLAVLHRQKLQPLLTIKREFHSLTIPVNWRVRPPGVNVTIHNAANRGCRGTLEGQLCSIRHLILIGSDHGQEHHEGEAPY
jgi:hypothetical protein